MLKKVKVKFWSVAYKVFSRLSDFFEKVSYWLDGLRIKCIPHPHLERRLTLRPPDDATATPRISQTTEEAYIYSDSVTGAKPRRR